MSDPKSLKTHHSSDYMCVSVLTIFIDEVNTCLKIKRVLKMQYEASFVPRPNKSAMADVWQKFSIVFDKKSSLPVEIKLSIFAHVIKFESL